MSKVIGPWTYDTGPVGEIGGEDKAWMDGATARIGAVVGGRWTYEAAEHWGGQNPWGLPFFIVAPIVLGGGKRLFEGFTQTIDLEHLGVRQSQYATFIDYRVR